MQTLAQILAGVGGDPYQQPQGINPIIAAALQAQQQGQMPNQAGAMMPGQQQMMPGMAQQQMQNRAMPQDPAMQLGGMGMAAGAY